MRRRTARGSERTGAPGALPWRGALLGLALALGPGVAPAAAQEAGGEEARLDSVPGPRALRVVIANGVVEYAKGARRARLHLVWELLPEDSVLRRRAPRARVAAFTFPNRALREWGGDRNQGDGTQTALEAAMAKGNFASFNLEGPDGWDASFARKWLSPEGEGYGLVAEQPAGLDPLQYYGVLQDHERLATLLGTAGVRFRLHGLPEPLYLEDEVRWRVRRYGFESRSAAGDSVSYYRYTIRAEVPDLEITLPEDVEAVELRLEADLVDPRGRNTAPAPAFFSEPVPVELTPAVESEVEKLKREEAQTALELLLELGGGATLGQVVTSGLLGASRHVSVASGALLNEDAVEAVLGANFEPWPRWPVRPGVLLGVSPTGGGSLYLGPSLSTQVVQLSFGLAAGEEARTTDAGEEGEIDFRWAGTLSFDLSRLSGQKRKPTRIAIRNPAAGGGWGSVSNLLMRGLALARVQVEPPAGQPPGQPVTVTLRRTHDAAGGRISGEAEKVAFPHDATGAGTLLFVPLGHYGVEAPDGYRAIHCETDPPRPLVKLYIDEATALNPVRACLEKTPAGAGAGGGAGAAFPRPPPGGDPGAPARGRSVQRD